MNVGGICHKWRDTGQCPYGAQCRFRHDSAAGRGRGRSSMGRGSSGGGGRGTFGGRTGVCHQWQQTGSCRWGNSCRYQHDGATTTTTAAARQKSSSSLTDLARFLGHMAAMPVPKLRDEMLEKASLWKRCWQSHQELDHICRRRMLEVLAKTPGSSSIEPPQIEYLESVVTDFLSHESAQTASDDTLLTAVKTTRDALTRCLEFEWTCPLDQVKAGLSKIVLLAEGKLKKQHEDHRNAAKQLMTILEDLEKDWRIKLKFLDQSVDVVAKPVSFDDWQKANVNWMCNPSFFAPSKCPKMKVGQNGVYGTKDEYIDCVHRLWVAMTFFDGHAAFAPHCRARGQAGSCSNALWPVVESRRLANLRCRTKGCDRSVEYCCRFPGHDSLCGRCASSSVANHLGGPGQGAATHVYDCKVKSITYDGLLHLEEFVSRNPPPKAVHWRTTGRLSPPSLVGVIKLRARGTALLGTDPIKWGEIVYHGLPRDETRRREHGELAVNMASITGSFDPDYFEEGSAVVVVDCMSFVPEWIPVLHSLESQKETRLPFDNGRYLNLWREDPIADLNSVLDARSADDAWSLDRSILISEMIDASQLEPVREIRRDEKLREELVIKLENLVGAATLDKMQLVSFVDALRNAVHLTQGPPGTGKSYLGVVLVRALMIVRDLWIRKSRSTGLAPILVLSYKNHAIDEFLVDLVKSEPGLSRNQLIRIGGQCKDPRLAAFSERSAFNYDPEVKDCVRRLDELTRLMESIRATIDGSMSSFLSFSTLIFFGDDAQLRRKAANDATSILMECIIRRKLLMESNVESSDLEGDGLLQELNFLRLQEDSSRASDKIYGAMSSTGGATFIQTLVEKAHPGEHWGDILLMWLVGRLPLPRCGAIEETSGVVCGNISLSPDILLCDIHRCVFLSLSSERCGASCTTSRLCGDHVCQVEDCSRRRLIDGQLLCRSHVCRQCVELGIVSALATDLPPRNFCEDHPLCVFPSCLVLAQSDEYYCERHNVLKCQALTKKELPCKGKPVSRSRPFCRDHGHLLGTMFDERNDLEDAMDVEVQLDVEKSRCVAIKRNSERCKGHCLPGTSYCYDHSMADHTIQEPAEAPEPVSDDHGTSQTVNSGRPNDASSASSVSSQCSSISAVSVDSESNGDDGVETLVVFEEEGEKLQHLRDVFEVNDETDLESIDSGKNLSVGIVRSVASTNSERVDVMTIDPNRWTWEMSVEERWNACQTTLKELRLMLGKASGRLKIEFTVARRNLHEARIRAKAKVYENKCVIGGTMVGCISRLESIRKTRPFAVVIEEASEVLEPLLFACLSESTMKLEMIGDHRQLQPSLMSRFDFEQVCNVNVSLFQRLIEAPSGHTVPSSVLSVQRRMRKNICDLTRDFYGDVTNIVDHETCGRQLIGERLPKTYRTMIENLPTSGREIPGISPHIFLWTHDGAQGRAHVGVSRINSQEAKMACGLAAYLVECGVPRQSITLLTPYKGQLMLMRDLAFKDPKISPLRLLSRNEQEKNVCRMSTVDRFQGDEEDIVICSLVVDENSKTGFVKLLNRMIVLLSRARLGLYIIGNNGYFERQGIPKHWTSTFERLRSPAMPDSTVTRNEHHYDGILTGATLPLCCPVHRETIAPVSSAAGLRLGFCKAPCHHALKCGHTCGLACHWPQSAHNSKCAMKMVSPCAIHPEETTCHDVYRNAAGAPTGTKHDAILDYFKCPVLVDLLLPCTHVVKLKCSVERETASGKLSVPSCHRPSPIPFTFPSCGHTRSVTCAEFVAFNLNPSQVKCEELEVFEPICGHSRKMKCFEKTKILEKRVVYICDKAVEMLLPRCGHQTKVPCPQVALVEGWIGEACKVVGVIEAGQSYGPQDFPCTQPVRLVLPCGHASKLQCCTAFAQSTMLARCQETVPFGNPRCGHPAQVPCSVVSDWKLNGVCVPGCLDLFEEGYLPQRPNVVDAPICKSPVRLKRACGHIENLSCSEAFKPQQGCSHQITCVSPVCGHDVRTPCRIGKELCGQSIWSVDSFSRLRDENSIGLGSEQVSDLTIFSVEAKRTFRSCCKSLTVSLPCGHDKDVACVKFLDCLEGPKWDDVQCEQLVSTRLPCGHKIEVKCSESGSDRLAVMATQCVGWKSVQCWNYELCNRTVRVECRFRGSVACDQEVIWTCPSGQHNIPVPLCSRGEPLGCFMCSRDLLGKTIREPPEFTGREDIKARLSEVAQPDRIEWMPLPEIKVTEREFLKRFMENCDNIEDKWDRPIFAHRRVPCFRMLAYKNRKMKKFDPKHFVKGAYTAFGMMTKLLTEENLGEMASGAKSGMTTLLVGYAFVAKTKVLDDLSFPRGDDRKCRKEKQDLFREAMLEEFDSMQFLDEGGYESLIVWDPFPVVSVCRISLDKNDLQALADKFVGWTKPDLRSSYITFRKPPDDTVVVQVHSEVDPDCDDSVIEDRQHAEEAATRLEGTCLEGLVLETNWLGGCCLDDELPKTVSNDLYSKMQFLNPHAKTFAAVQLLRTLLEQPMSKHFHLFMSAELLGHDTNEAQQSFDQYLELLRGSPNEKLHPWALVVAARLGSTRSQQLLETYYEFFPLYLNCLNDDERRALGLIGAKDEPELAAPDLEVLTKEWEAIRSVKPDEAVSPATDELLKLTGLRKVKQEVLRLWKSALQLKRMDPEARKQNQITANYCFVGNPGCGKTTVARLFGQILQDAGIRQEYSVVETTAQEAKDGGSDEFKSTVKKAMGGTLFIDEAYDLDPVGDFKGRPIVNELLILCENKRDEISFILAGYADDFESKFFAYNDGLKSRFKEIVFEDFDESELVCIWCDMRSSKKWQEDDSVSRVAARRVVKQAGRKGFGNARAVRQLLELATQSALARLGDEFAMDRMVLKIEDVIGADPRLSSPKLVKAVEDIEQMIGWSRVKGRVREVIEVCGTNYRRELLGKPPMEMILNRLFLGNPGTGKTTCAKLYGRLLKEVGFLSSGDVVAKTASDFVGSHVGESQKKTSTIIEGARGKVLLIDEAYALDDSLYGKQVLDTIVEKIQGGPADDIAVLLLGYEQQMLKMIETQNPGLARRFPKEQAFFFDDYNDNELMAILGLYLKKQDVDSTLRFKEKALSTLQSLRRQSNFGNAGTVETLAKGAMQKSAKRVSNSPDIVLDDIDIGDAVTTRANKAIDALSQLDKFYRMEKVKEKLDAMQKNLAVARREGGEEPELGHFVFLGSPGTGKTSVARVIADILYSLSLIPLNKIVEKTALDLTADFVGQTTTKVNDVLREAKGGVLFIDEAYYLGEGPYGKEACDTLVAAMTSEKYRDVLIVIAGYPSEMQRMLDSNSGLKSRFSNFFEFPNWKPEDCVSSFSSVAGSDMFSLEDGVLEAVRAGCTRLSQLKGWANGRDVKKLWTEAMQNRAPRVYDKTGYEKTIRVEDIQAAIGSMLQARIGKHTDTSALGDPLAQLDRLFRMERIKAQLERLQRTWAVERREGNGVVPNLSHFVFKGSPGTGKTTVARAIASVLFGLELKASDKLVETTGLELQGEYLGQTAPKVKAALEDAKGGTLFIDEAYTLGEGKFGKEACDTLVAGMTSEQYKDVLIVIAGYPAEMDEMFRSNAGLKSRFTHFFEFPDWTPEDCVSFFGMCLAKEGFTSLDEETVETLRVAFSELVALEGWANGRDVKQVFDESKSHRAERVFDLDHPEESKSILGSDVGPAVATILQARRPKEAAARDSTKRPIDELSATAPLDSIKQQYASRFASSEQKLALPSESILQAHTSLQVEQDAWNMIESQDALHDEEDDSITGNSPAESHNDGVSSDNDSSVSSALYEGRDDGVSDDVWDELELAKQSEDRLTDSLTRLKQEYADLVRREEEAKRRHEEELKRIRQELARQEQERALREAEEAERQRRVAEEAERKRIEDERRRIESEIRRKEAIKARLRKIGPCPMNFDWYQVGGGWRCYGGTHFVTDEQLQQQFGYDA